MPNVNGKKFPYTKKGKAAAKKAKGAMKGKKAGGCGKMPKKRGY